MVVSDPPSSSSSSSSSTFSSLSKISWPIGVEIEGVLKEVEGLPNERLERSPPAFVGEPTVGRICKLGPCLPGTMVEEEVDS